MTPPRSSSFREVAVGVAEALRGTVIRRLCRSPGQTFIARAADYCVRHSSLISLAKFMIIRSYPRYHPRWWLPGRRVVVGSRGATGAAGRAGSLPGCYDPTS
jgi:hypothetical protein